LSGAAGATGAVLIELPKDMKDAMATITPMIASPAIASPAVQ
jgi:hypothetical protein